ncbi:hypothetical protein [Cupriavidus sp. SK-3]|uniref:hypothetical protein n=1 Tax=Cupriavidus sp. SK-3 TaxID=1470558 RepID=UPI0009DC99BF|nr:hypothetical protein [Cupriavidus sp. SK-3]
MVKKLFLIAVAGAALGAGTAYAGIGTRDVFTDGARVMGPRDPYTDGNRATKFDVYSDGAKSSRFDVYTDGTRVTDRRDSFTDGG